MFNVPHNVVDEMISREAKWVGVHDDGIHVHFFSKPLIEVGYCTPSVHDKPFFINREWSKEFYDDLYVRPFTWGEQFPPRKCDACGRMTMITLIEREHRLDKISFGSPGIYVDKCLECGDSEMTTFEATFLGYYYWLSRPSSDGKWKFLNRISVREANWFKRGFGL